MRFSGPLVPGRLLRRYKRFLADVELGDGRPVVAHCPNPGSMLGLAEPGREVWLSCCDDPRRRLAYALELVRDGTALVGVNAARANAVVAEAIRAGAVPELAGYDTVRREVACGGSRLDFRLDGVGRAPCYVEVKSVTLRRGGPAEFPDAVTARGARHLGELAALAGRGARAVLLFLVQRADCASFTLAEDIDPAYAAAFARAREAGVEALCYACVVTRRAVALERPLPFAPRAAAPAGRGGPRALQTAAG